VRTGLGRLADGYDQRRSGLTLRRVGEGWRLYTREEHAPVVERYLIDGQRSRLTQAALETLAVIAYRQPVTRARVSAIRGVGVDGVMRTLLTRGLVHEVGTDPDSGGGLYATTPLFLERLGLRSLEDLPELAPLLPETSTMLDEHPDS
jgi:segregation and condensation protein B